MDNILKGKTVFVKIVFRLIFFIQPQIMQTVNQHIDFSIQNTKTLMIF